MAYDENTAERVRGVLKGRRDIVEKPLMGGLSFMASDVMCCSVSGRGGLLVRVIPETREAHLREPHAEPADMRGRVMTGFVRVQPEGYRTEAALKKWIAHGLAAAAARPKEKAPKKAVPKAAAKKRKRK
jgi:TfoX/Sxy family transcriptional regulator of competence genes